MRLPPGPDQIREIFGPLTLGENKRSRPPCGLRFARCLSSVILAKGREKRGYRVTLYGPKQPDAGDLRPRLKLARMRQISPLQGRREIASGWFGSDAGAAGIRVATGPAACGGGICADHYSSLESPCQMLLSKRTTTSKIKIKAEYKKPSPQNKIITAPNQEATAHAFPKCTSPIKLATNAPHTIQETTTRSEAQISPWEALFSPFQVLNITLPGLKRTSAIRYCIFLNRFCCSLMHQMMGKPR